MGHVPQDAMRPPQPSPAGPQSMPWLTHVSGMHVPLSMAPQTPSVPPPPHDSPDGHVPQASVPPQPSPAGPHRIPSAVQVVGTQHVPPHTLGVPPPPHVSQAAVHVPHESEPPQPSPAGPQLIPRLAHVCGVQLGPGVVGHEARSQMRYSSDFSCAIISPVVHSFGKAVPSVPPEFVTWKSL
jgi:hypothetical protein